MPSELDIHNKALSYILAIAECGTITAAADQLFISQPALSRYLRALEDRLNITLFDRIDNRLYLTSVGRQYVDYARRIHDLETEMVQTLTLYQNEERKRVLLGIPEHWVSFLVPSLVISLRTLLPSVELEIVDVSSQYLEELLLDRKVDLTISRRPNNEQAIASRLLHDDPIYLAAPQNLASRLKTTGRTSANIPIVSLEELPRLRYILPKKGQSLRKKIDLIFQDLNAVPSETLTCRSIEASMRLVGDDYGCCFLSGMHMRSVYTRNQPVFFAIDHPQAVLSLHINYLARRTLPPHIQQCIRYIAATI